MREELNDAIAAARKAGEVVMRYYEGEADVQWKDENSPVTAADMESQRVILDFLRERSEHEGFLSEELQDDLSRLQKERVWIIDPLDGTKDFLEKTGEFCVMIGMAERGAPMLGAVYQPVSDTLYTATRGGGAFVERGGKRTRMRTKEVAAIEDARLLVSRSHLGEDEKRLIERTPFSSVSAMGSLGLKISAIAEGRAEATITFTDKTSEWDVCAAHVILREAGGRITDVRGQEFTYNKEDSRNREGIVATNGMLHPRFLRLVDERGA